MSETPQPSGAREALPVDVETVSADVDDALAMQLGTSTRAAIDRYTSQLLEHVNLLVTTDLGTDTSDETKALVRASYHLLDLNRRPTLETPVYEAHAFLRETAQRTRSLLSTYMSRQGISL